MDNNKPNKKAEEPKPDTTAEPPLSINASLAKKAKPLPQSHLDFYKNVLKKEPKNIDIN